MDVPQINIHLLFMINSALSKWQTVANTIALILLPNKIILFSFNETIQQKILLLPSYSSSSLHDQVWLCNHTK